jgi:hypothetical protein
VSWARPLLLTIVADAISMRAAAKAVAN